MKKLVYILLVCVVVKSRAQNNNSPYSIIGIGDLEKSSLDRTSGMGHAGIALSSNRFMYNANPASYIYLGDSVNQYFHIETNVRFRSVDYSGAPISNAAYSQSTDMQIKKVALAFKIKPRWWAVSLGLLPFSTSNYSFNNQKTIPGSNQVLTGYIQGSGNTNQFYLANSFRIAKGLSIGIQSSFLFGQLGQTETIQTTYITDSLLVTNRNLYLSNLYFKFGFQYKTKLSKGLVIAFGGTASPQTKLQANYSLKVTDGASVVLDNESYQNNFFTLPAMATGGIAATIKDKYILAVDYNYQDWSKFNYKGIGYSLVSSNRISVGAEYVNRERQTDNVYHDKFFLQAGFYYSNSYLRIYGQQLDDIGGTIGAGFTFLRTKYSPQGSMSVAGALEIGTRGTTSNGLIKENYTQFGITLSYRDFWYSRPKRYD